MPEPRNPNTPISVIMPVHNGGTYLDAAVKSILEQIDVELELIIIDDYSTDNAIENLAKNDRIRILRSAEHGLKPGIVAALNLGWKAARFPLIARMDADDIAAPIRLRSQLDFYCQNSDVALVGAQVEIFKSNSDTGQGFW